MGILKLRYPIKKGVFSSENDIIPLFNYIYKTLDVSAEEIKEHPILITEPILNPYCHRKQIANALFENLGVPAMFFASQPILSLFATKDRTGIILESGEGITQCCAVYEGYTIPHSYLRNDYGGRNVTEYLQTLLRKVGFTFTSTVLILRQTELEIVKKIKESECISLLLNNTVENTSKFYVLPDGSSISLKDEKSLAPEMLFNPSMVGLEYMSFPEMIMSCLSKVDIDIRKNLYNHILLTGGNTMFKALPERMKNEVAKSTFKGNRVSYSSRLEYSHRIIEKIVAGLEDLLLLRLAHLRICGLRNQFMVKKGIFR